VRAPPPRLTATGAGGAKAVRESTTAHPYAGRMAPLAVFLLSLQDAAPDFDVIGLPQAADLPAVKWKLLNLQKLISENPAKHDEQKALLLALWT
jgi:hypothetical protein